MAHDPHPDQMSENCPFLWANRKECYCVGITSSRVYHAIRYCGTYYLDCPVLQDLKGLSGIMPKPEPLPFGRERRPA